MAIQARTLADHQERLNQVLSYIQENLDGSLSLETLSKVACFSPCHFHRVFAENIGEPLNAYIRRLRLEAAAFALCCSEEPITNIALSVGYETAAAFSKAFKQHFGKNPSEFKKLVLPAFPALPTLPSLPPLPSLPSFPAFPSFQEMLDVLRQNWEGWLPKNTPQPL